MSSFFSFSTNLKYADAHTRSMKVPTSTPNTTPITALADTLSIDDMDTELSACCDNGTKVMFACVTFAVANDVAPILFAFFRSRAFMDRSLIARSKVCPTAMAACVCETKYGKYVGGKAVTIVVTYTAVHQQGKKLIYCTTRFKNNLLLPSQ